ncbi:unnamed protein product [Blepharisma stoltei]|uniref:Oxysterol-binding protein n=1 Tax=Blepharisma stoltei TaxID=1481888 RepID=A0AAU9IRB4_9CILI|nr:unnamed protein product [Blepharisma stoltei]
MESIDDPCTTPRDGSNREIWSEEIGFLPYSLLLGCLYDRETPPPTYTSIRVLNRERPGDKQSQLRGYELVKEGGLKCVDEQVLAKQKGIIIDVIGQVTACLLQGKGVVGLSLPIRLFEPRSTLERMLDRWSFMPVYFDGINRVDRLEKFKRVIAMAIAGLYISPSQEKPFNPLLGETLQAEWPNGTKAFCEHTSHHPPITNFYVENRHFKMHGHLELTGKFKKNSLIGGFHGNVNVEFTDGQKISFTYPRFRAGGMIMGSRTVNWEGDMEFVDEANGLIATLIFGPAKKKGFFSKAVGKLDDFKGSIMENDEKICDVSGSWLRNLEIGDTEYWNIDTHRPVFHTFPANPLPSDWRYREDLVWLLKGNSEIAQKWKIKVENRQRDDRKLRGLKY